MMDIEGLYRRYGPMVLRRCRSMLKDEEKALDAMQDCFVQLLRRRESLTDDSPSSLLYQIATNTCLNMIRAEKTRKSSGDEALEYLAAKDDVEKAGIAKHLVDWVFERESPSTRVIAWLHYVDGLTLEETAKVVALSVSGVRKRLAGLKARYGDFDGRPL